MKTAEIEHTKALLQKNKHQLQITFEQWWHDNYIKENDLLTKRSIVDQKELNEKEQGKINSGLSLECYNENWSSFKENCPLSAKRSFSPPYEKTSKSFYSAGKTANRQQEMYIYKCKTFCMLFLHL
ncbi:hypothetical protein RFI_12692 [Reticulomyxa filosa]|uniref:Uncharacterized protein n=1 Tax=Reticulomyxa filosa TaxID=46433 RepID=X6NDR9_RETFI|nr:hypothetical protein RFI_12692 [Reticulomyxa filosa]|eukprot:ETO24465.1 hypothetical protein RFI_12692 [Reticulomyxa filosa]